MQTSHRGEFARVERKALGGAVPGDLHEANSSDRGCVAQFEVRIL